MATRCPESNSVHNLLDQEGIKWNRHRRHTIRPICCSGEHWLFSKELITNKDALEIPSKQLQLECLGCASLWETSMDDWPGSGEPRRWMR